MDYRDDLDQMDLSAISTEYDRKRINETPYEKSMRKAVKSLTDTTEQLRDNQIMHSRLTYESAKALHEKEQGQNSNVVIVPVFMNRE